MRLGDKKDKEFQKEGKKLMRLCGGGRKLDIPVNFHIGDRCKNNYGGSSSPSFTLSYKWMGRGEGTYNWDLIAEILRKKLA